MTIENCSKCGGTHIGSHECPYTEAQAEAHLERLGQAAYPATFLRIKTGKIVKTQDERNDRLRAKRQLKYDKERRTITAPDPRDPDYTRVGMFILHNCSRCKDGREACVAENPRQCEYPHARND